MIRNWKLTISKKTQSQWLIWALFMLPFLCSLFIDLLHLPSAVRYLMDICWCALLLLMFLNKRKLYHGRPFTYWVGGFALYGAVSYLFLFQSPLFFLWGFRNNFRLYVLFLAVMCFLRGSEKKRYLQLLDILFWINVLLTFVQFFALGYDGDYLGGIFGVQTGSNGYTNVLLIIYLAKTVLWYMNGMESMVSTFAKTIMCMIIAAMAELKFYYVEAVIAIFLASVIGKFNWKNLLVLVFASIAFFFGITLLITVFPKSSAFLELSTLLKAATSVEGYTNTGDLNRLNAIGRITNEIMSSPWEQFFGYGLGNCDTAVYSFLQTPFSLKYEYLHYTWLSTAFIFLEMGWTGLVFFFGFFALVYLKANKLRKQGGENQPYCQLAMIVAAMCVLIAIYNSSLRTEAGYMAYFVMALPFVRQEQIPKAETAS